MGRKRVVYYYDRMLGLTCFTLLKLIVKTYQWTSAHIPMDWVIR